MRKICKKFLAVTTALMMLLINVNAVFAEGPTGTITFHTGSSDVNGVTFKIYKIFDVTTSGSNVGYSVNSDFSKFFEDNNQTGDDSYTYVRSNVANSAFQNAIKTYVTTKPVDAKAILTRQTDKKTYTASALEYGYYVIIPSGDNFTPSFTTLASANQNVYLKGTEPGVDKKVEDAEWTGAQIGDTVHFKVTSSVPNMTGYETYYFKLTDIASNGLTVSDGTLNSKVTIGSTSLTEGVNYTATVSEQTITIVISNFIDYKDQANEEIVFEYDAVLNEHAVSADPETNTANVHWGNDPEHLKGGKPDIVNVYTYKLTIKKTDGTNNPLNGAEFELYKGSDVSSGSKLSFVKTEEGAYRVAKPRDTSTTTTLTTPPATTTPATGLITIEGLDDGTYQLVETKAPDGYNKLEEPKPITISATSGNDGATVNVEGNKVTVANKAGTLLPETGGMGTMLFTLVGVAGILVVAYSFVASNKKKKQVGNN